MYFTRTTPNALEHFCMSAAKIGTMSVLVKYLRIFSFQADECAGKKTNFHAVYLYAYEFPL